MPIPRKNAEPLLFQADEHPRQGTTAEALREADINCDYSQYVAYRHYIFNRYKKEEGFDLGLYSL